MAASNKYLSNYLYNNSRKIFNNNRRITTVTVLLKKQMDNIKNNIKTVMVTKNIKSLMTAMKKMKLLKLMATVIN